jgi:hypothetical protein
VTRRFVLQRNHAVSCSAPREHIPCQERRPDRDNEHHNACRLGHRRTGITRRRTTRAGRVGGDIALGRSRIAATATGRPAATPACRPAAATAAGDDVLTPAPAAAKTADQPAKATKSHDTAAQCSQLRDRSRWKRSRRQRRVLAGTRRNSMLLAPIRIWRTAARRTRMNIFVVQPMPYTANNVVHRILMMRHRRQATRNVSPGDRVTRIVDHYSSKARPRRSQRPNMVERYKQSRKMESFLLPVHTITRVLTPYQ